MSCAGSGNFLWKKFHKTSHTIHSLSWQFDSVIYNNLTDSGSLSGVTVSCWASMPNLQMGAKSHQIYLYIINSIFETHQRMLCQPQELSIQVVQYLLQHNVFLQLLQLPKLFVLIQDLLQKFSNHFLNCQP